MRVIKFRAWDEHEKRFWYFELQDVLERRMSYRGSWDEKIMKGVKQQYTGLVDRNGQEIYEGDIVLYNDTSLREVRWNKHRFEYAWYNIGYGEPTYIYALGDDSKSDLLQLVGNIYENKKLLGND